MALSLLAANNAQTVLAAGISSTATSLTVNAGTGTLFPSPVAGTSFFKLTIIDAATGSLTEIIHVTAINGDVFTIQRGQEGTVPRSWSANDIVANMMTAGTLSYILGSFQPLDPTLTALAALVGVANKLPYFNGDDTAALTDLTQVGRDIIGKSSIADILTYLDLVNNGVVGRLIGVQVITSTQTYTETPGTKFRRVQIVGAGGGGGGCPSTGASQQSTARGGQCGAYLDVVIYGSLSPVSVTIGSKGTGGTSAPTPGTDGGTSSFGNLISCPGGIGGNAGAVASSTSNIIGDSPIGNSPTLNFGTTQYKIILTKPCLYGAMRQISIGALIGQVCGGDGGDSPLGTSGHGGSGAAGGDAAGYGAGGGGSSQIQSNNGDKGGAGASGVCIIWEYA